MFGVFGGERNVQLWSNQDWCISGAGPPVAITAAENLALSTIYFLRKSSRLSFQTKSGKACRLFCTPIIGMKGGSTSELVF